MEDEKLPSIQLEDVETGESVELYVIEETMIAGRKYLLVAEDDAEESEAYIFREEKSDDEEVTYQPVEDDAEYDAIASVFEELLDDTTFES